MVFERRGIFTAEMEADMHRHYYLFKAGVIAIAALTVGLNSGAGTRQMADELAQAHASTVQWVEVTAGNVRGEVVAALEHLITL